VVEAAKGICTTQPSLRENMIIFISNEIGRSQIVIK